jgi:aminopeptidase N
MNKYNTEGYGLTYLIDVDKKQYVYTHFEPVGCRNVFPCFDFPSFKAPM